jgi:hypothetical protein
VSGFDWDVLDIIVPATPGSLMRATQLWQKGYFRVSRRDCEVYSIQITSSGSWAALYIYNGLGRILFHMDSAFTGSFWLSAGAEEGLIVHLHSRATPPTITVNFREKDLKLL